MAIAGVDRTHHVWSPHHRAGVCDQSAWRTAQRTRRGAEDHPFLGNVALDRQRGLGQRGLPIRHDRAAPALINEVPFEPWRAAADAIVQGRFGLGAKAALDQQIGGEIVTNDTEQHGSPKKQPAGFAHAG